MAKAQGKKGEGAGYLKKSPKRRPGRHRKKVGMKSGFTGKHHR